MSAPGRLYFGHVAHRRIAPIKHKFRYSIFSMVIDIDWVDEVAQALKLFSSERFNLFSFYRKDHGARDGSALRPWVEAELRRYGVEETPYRIELLCFPRILGHVFNPLSIYYCQNIEGALFAIVYEFKNTHGGQHSYVAPLGRPSQPDKVATAHEAEKAFYISPFIGMKARYIFGASLPGEKLQLTINEIGPKGPTLWVGWFGTRTAMSDGQLLKALFRYPLMTLKVVAGMHWEALWIFLKGVKFRPQPTDLAEHSSEARVVLPSKSD